MGKHTIWQNYDMDDFTTDDYREYLEDSGYYDEEEIEELLSDDYNRYDWADDLNREYFEDEKYNLKNISYPYGILVTGTIGRWDGLHSGYNIIESGDVSDCLEFSKDCDYAGWYVDDDGTFYSEQSHHDGNNYFEYRAITDDGLIDDFEYGKEDGSDLTKEEIFARTKPIGPDIAKVYGWSVKTNESLKESKKINEAYKINAKRIYDWVNKCCMELYEDKWGTTYHYTLNDELGLALILANVDDMDSDEGYSPYVKIADTHDYLLDWDYSYMPYNKETGDVWDTELPAPISMADAEWLVDEYFAICDGVEKGEIIVPGYNSEKF